MHNAPADGHVHFDARGRLAFRGASRAEMRADGERRVERSAFRAALRIDALQIVFDFVAKTRYDAVGCAIVLGPVMKFAGCQ